MSKKQRPWYHTLSGIDDIPGNDVVIALLKGKFSFLGTSVLDLGCAEGAYAKFALDQGAKRAVGVENSKFRQERQQEWLSAELSSGKFLLIDKDMNQPHVSRLVGSHGPFDVVFAMNISHHLRRPFEFLASYAQLVTGELGRSWGCFITTGFDLEGKDIEHDEPKRGWFQYKLSSATVCTFMRGLGFEARILGTYRLDRQVILCER